MHELSVINNILTICIDHAQKNGAKKVVAIQLNVGEMSDLEPEWMQKYFDGASKDTIAEGAALNIHRSPVTCRCNGCKKEFIVDVRKTRQIVCPECRTGRFEILSGNEYLIQHIKVI